MNYKVEYTHGMSVGGRSMQGRKTIVVARIASDFPNKACITPDHRTTFVNLVTGNLASNGDFR